MIEWEGSYSQHTKGIHFPMMLTPHFPDFILLQLVCYLVLAGIASWTLFTIVFDAELRRSFTAEQDTWDHELQGSGSSFGS